jgi:centrosomal protein CEP76
MADSQKKDGDGAPSPSPDAAVNGAVAPPAGTPAPSPVEGTADGAGEKAPLSAPDAVQGSAKPTGDSAGASEKGKDPPKKEDAVKDVQADIAAKKASVQAAAAKRARAWKQMAKKDGEEEEAADEMLAMSESQKPSMLQRCFGACLPKGKAGHKSRYHQDGVSFEKVYRPFEISLNITSIKNVLAEPVDAFFCVKVTSAAPKTHKNKTAGKLLPQYTGALLLKASDNFVFENPEPLYIRQKISLSYFELKKHQLQVDMWRVSQCSFNTYYGCNSKNLFNIANGDPNVSVFLKKVIGTAEGKKKKGKKTGIGQVYDVALFHINVQLEEIFDFNLRFENFSFEPNIDHKDYKHWVKQKKSLTFIVPKSLASDPQNGRRCHSKSQEYVAVLPDQGGFIWKDPLECLFSGTRTQLTTSCFLVNVYSGTGKIGAAQIGKALLGLTSILELSVFKGTVKNLSSVEQEFRIGRLNGNVRYRLRSKGIGDFVDQLPLGCPMQPAAASISHLKQKEKHLVVCVNKCDGLPVANPDFGWSDPYLRVSWDNMVKQSWTSPQTTRPVFNINFYFPVRLFSPKLETRRYSHTALLYEIQSKGPLKIMVWDEDPSANEMLGSVTLHMADILSQATKMERTLKGKVKKDGDDEQNEFVKKKKLQWYDELEMVRVYDGGQDVGGTELRGSTLKTTTKPLIFFEAYFYPDDWPLDLNFDQKHSSKALAEKWLNKEKIFRSENKDFQKQYKQAFPESIGALPVSHDTFTSRAENVRRFPCVAENQNTDLVALPAFLVKIIAPEEYSRASFLLHWVSCFTFHTDTRQTRHGQVERWNDPQMFLFARQGSPQDHAILLCSILLGTKRDAYVVKGMVYQREAELFEAKGKDKSKAKKDDQEVRRKLCEHVWVMTREANDWVTFWEPCTREIYHLKNRYKEARAKKKRKEAMDAKLKHAMEADEGEAEADPDAEAQIVPVEEFWEAEVPDITIGADEIEQLPTVGRTPKAKVKVKKETASAAEKMKEQLMAQREKLATAPLRRLIDPEASLVDWLPYDSIEIVFNNVNVWANHQNHHPACIMYDLEDFCWCKLLKND